MPGMQYHTPAAGMPVVPGTVAHTPAQGMPAVPGAQYRTPAGGMPAVPSMEPSPEYEAVPFQVQALYPAPPDEQARWAAR